MRRVLGLLISFASLWPLNSLAADSWSQPYVGIELLNRTTTSPNRSIHVAVVNLRAPGISLGTTASDERRQKTSTYARSVGAAIAVNGDFFSPGDNFKPSGIAISNGIQWPDTQDENWTGNLAFGNGRAELFTPKTNFKFNSWMKGVVSGRHLLVNNGVVQGPLDDAKCKPRRARTAIGLDQAKRNLIVAVVDEPKGMTCTELAKLMKEMGAHRALNFDGGGSSVMVVDGNVVSNPSDPGGERTVANHLAIFANNNVTTGVLRGIVYEEPNFNARLPGVRVGIAGGKATTTDANGNFEFRLKPGDYKLMAKLNGFTPVSLERSVAAGETVWGSFGMSEKGAEGALKGVVFTGGDSTHRVEDATIEILGEQVLSLGKSGFYETAISPGNYVVVASHPKYVASSTIRAVSANQTTWGSLELQPLGSIKTGTLRGVVFSGSTNGSRVEGALVRALPSGNAVLTDKKGIYSLELPQGEHTIYVEADGFEAEEIVRTIGPGQKTWGSVVLTSPQSLSTSLNGDANAAMGCAQTRAEPSAAMALFILLATSPALRRRGRCRE